MPKVIPFKACRPARDKAGLVGSRSFIEYSETDLTDKLVNNPYTFLHVIYPDFGTPKYVHERSTARFKKVREKYEEFVEQNILLRDEEPGFYIYQQQKGDHAFTGIIGGVAAKAYRDGKVKVHEHTLTAREQMFKEYLKETAINAEPVLLAHEHSDTLEQVIQQITKQRADFEFTTTDQITHYLWPVFNHELINQIRIEFDKMEAFYIADGHHRSASSALLAEENGSSENAQYFMCYLLSERMMHIQPFYRFIHGLNDLSITEFKEKLAQFFALEATDHAVVPATNQEFGMYIDHQWYTLRTKPEWIVHDHPVKQLDCCVLHDHVLDGILGITDAKTDKRIDYQGGHIGTDGVEQLVNSTRFDVGFTLYHVSMEQLKRVADTGNIMPPKSTWVEPKLRSGLVIYEF